MIDVGISIRKNTITYHEFFETMTNTRVMCRWYVGLSTNIFDEI